MQAQVIPNDPDVETPTISSSLEDKAERVTYFPNTGTLDITFNITESNGMEDYSAPDGFVFSAVHTYPKHDHMTVSFRHTEA